MNSSKSAGFSSAELSALSAWDLPNIGISRNSSETGKSEPVDLDTVSSPVLTVEEIEAMQQQAYDEAFAQGKQEGFKQGFDQGFQEGSQKGYDENVQVLNKQAAEFSGLMESLTEPFKILDEEVVEELVKLAIGIATQIIRREIKMDPGQIVAAVREAIKVLPLSSQKIKLILHPEDVELVRAALSLDEMSMAWSVIEDPLITRGGCKVDTDVSHIDATIENRMTAVISTILGSEREQDCNHSVQIPAPGQEAVREEDVENQNL